MAQPQKWNLDNYRAYSERRDRLIENYNNNINIVKQRSIPAALDYPGAANEVVNAKTQIETSIHDIVSEGETLSVYLKQIQSELGPDMVIKINEDENKLKKLIEENNIMENKAVLRKGQAQEQETKYDSNFHSSVFSYMPWEVQYSSWYSFSPTNPYIDLSQGARSTLLFIACIFGLSSLIIVTAFILDFLKTNNINVFDLMTSGIAKITPQPQISYLPTRLPALPLPVIKRVR